jgi:hypothetical protein
MAFDPELADHAFAYYPVARWKSMRLVLTYCGATGGGCASRTVEFFMSPLHGCVKYTEEDAGDYDAAVAAYEAYYQPGQGHSNTVHFTAPTITRDRYFRTDDATGVVVFDQTATLYNEGEEGEIDVSLIRRFMDSVDTRLIQNGHTLSFNFIEDSVNFGLYVDPDPLAFVDIPTYVLETSDGPLAANYLCNSCVDVECQDAPGYYYKDCRPIDPYVVLGKYLGTQGPSRIDPRASGQASRLVGLPNPHCEVTFKSYPEAGVTRITCEPAPFATRGWPTLYCERLDRVGCNRDVVSTTCDFPQSFGHILVPTTNPAACVC